jgi:hypothetical protein
MDDQNTRKPLRDEKGRILPGQSLNPQGGNKPKLFRDSTGRKLSIQDFYTDNAARVAYELYKVITDPETPATARISGIKEFNDRAFGRPQQTTVMKKDELVDSEYDLTDVAPEILRQIITAKLVDRSGDE